MILQSFLLNYCSKKRFVQFSLSAFQVIYERGNLSQKTLQIINSTLPAALKEALQREVQFWSATTTLKVSIQ